MIKDETQIQPWPCGNVISLIDALQPIGFEGEMESIGDNVVATYEGVNGKERNRVMIAILNRLTYRNLLSKHQEIADRTAAYGESCIWHQ